MPRFQFKLRTLFIATVIAGFSAYDWSQELPARINGDENGILQRVK